MDQKTGEKVQREKRAARLQRYAVAAALILAILALVLSKALDGLVP